VVSAVPAVVPVVEVDAVFAVARRFAPAIPEAYNLAPTMAPTSIARESDGSSDLQFLGDVFTFRADLGKRGLAEIDGFLAHADAQPTGNAGCGRPG
jgi:hypothetical protein